MADAVRLTSLRKRPASLADWQMIERVVECVSYDAHRLAFRLIFVDKLRWRKHLQCGSSAAAALSRTARRAAGIIAREEKAFSTLGLF